MRQFLIIWLGQLLSLLGSAMTRFVLALWLWEQTSEATAMVLVGFSAGIASLLANFIAGPLVDRWSRKAVILAADSLAGLTTLVLLLLAASGQLAPWHIYLVSAIGAVFGTFHYLAFSASLTLLIPKEQYTRANSLLSVARYGSGIGAPILAGILIAPIGIAGVMLLDLATLAFALITVAIIAFPQVPPERGEKQSGVAAMLVGFRYIFARPSLRGLMLVVFAFVLFESFGYPLIAPMILARTGGDAAALGIVQSVLGIGGVIGGIVTVAWGGFRRRIHGILLGLALTGLLGDTLMGSGTTLPVWLAAAIGLEVFIPLVFSSDGAIWQSKVDPALQGRVFAARNILTGLGEPFALLATGLMADRIFEPAMQPDGALAPIFGSIVGTGDGAGMGLLLFFCGIGCALVSLWGYASHPIRDIETILPDHDSVAIETV